MSYSYYLLFIVIFLWVPSHASKKSSSLGGCPKTFSNKSNSEEVISLEQAMPLEKLVQSLHELRVYSTADFIIRKNAGELPEEILELLSSPELREKRDSLWKKVRVLKETEDVEDRQRGGEKIADEESLTFEVFPRDEITEIIINEDSNRDNLSNNQRPKKNTSRRRIVKSSGISVVDDPQVHKEVSSLIENNKYITIAEIAIETGLANTTIYYVIEKLKKRKKKRLARRGSKNKGYWVFLEEGVKQLSNKEIQKRRRENILFLIRQNSRIKINQLASEIELSPPMISIIIRELKDGGYLVRDGSHLKVLKGGEQYYDLHQEI